MQQEPQDTTPAEFATISDNEVILCIVALLSKQSPSLRRAYLTELYRRTVEGKDFKSEPHEFVYN